MQNERQRHMQRHVHLLNDHATRHVPRSGVLVFYLSHFTSTLGNYSWGLLFLTAPSNPAVHKNSRYFLTVISLAIGQVLIA